MSQIHETAIVDSKAEIGEDVEIGPYAIIGPDVTIGKGCKIHAHVVIEGRTTLGFNNEVFSFACLGKAPQHLNYKGEPAQLIIGDNNIIREHCTMHIGTAGDNMKTIVGSHGMFMVASHVAHDCVVGDHMILAQNAALGGHVKVGDHVYFGAYAAAHQMVRIGHSAIIGAMSAVVADVIPYGAVYGERGYLNGLNLIGMKRRGMSREDIRSLREAYDALFQSDDVFQTALARVAIDLGDVKAVQDVVDFIQADSKRNLCSVKKT